MKSTNNSILVEILLLEYRRSQNVLAAERASSIPCGDEIF